jgi:hypothetical protein
MAAPGYTYLTLGEARTQLAARLEDNGRPGQGPYVFWTVPELDDLLVEAIRTWQALTGAFKQRAVFTIFPSGGVGGSAFYDLRNFPSGILSFFVTDAQVIKMALASLLEPPLTPDWTGTGQYSFGQIVSALQNRINRWLTDTGANVTRHIQFVGPDTSGPSVSRIFLPEGVLDVRRAAWQNTAGVYSTLWRDDEYAMQAFLNSGSLAPRDPPLVWGKFTLPPVGLEVYPPPLNPGQLETLVVTSGPQIGATPAQVANTPTVLDIPEDFVWGMVFGALSDLFSADGPARDPERAVYAESRYQESAELYRNNPTLLQTQINGVPVWSGSVFEMDSFLASWQQTTGAPQFAGMCDRNLVAFGPLPNTAYSVMMDVVSNIPIPVLDSDYIQMDRGALNPLIDYAFHLASFKMQGAEFKATDKLRQNFYLAAALENSRLTKAHFYRTALQLPPFRQQAEAPRI